MQIGSANLLALQQAQAKPAKAEQPSQDFDTALAQEAKDGFEPLNFAKTPQAPNAADAPAPYAPASPPGAQIDIKV